MGNLVSRFLFASSSLEIWATRFRQCDANAVCGPPSKAHRCFCWVAGRWRWGHLKGVLLHKLRKSRALDNGFLSVHNVGISRIEAACNFYHRAQRCAVGLSRPAQDQLLDSRPLVKRTRLQQMSLSFLPSLLKASLSRCIPPVEIKPCFLPAWPSPLL